MALIRKNGNCLQVQGAMTMENVNALLAESAPVFDSNNLEMDLSAVPDVDSAAISLLFEWLRQAHARNASLVFVNLPSNLASLASLYGVLDLIPHHQH
jgi:phospholipid transport system transporter-binding protein